MISLAGVLSSALSQIRIGAPMNILDPQGPIGAAEKTILIDSVGDHAGDRGADNHRHFRLRILVPAIQPARDLHARIGPIPAASNSWCGRSQRSPSSCSAASPGSARMSSIRRSRSRERGRASPSRWCRSTGNGCSSIPDQRIATLNTLTVPVGAPLHFRTDLRQRDERVLHPAIRQHDLHHERHDDPARSCAPMRSAAIRACRRISAATVFPTCCSTSMWCRRTSFPNWATKTAHGDNALNADSLQGIGQAVRAKGQGDLSARRSGAVPGRSRPSGSPPGPGPEQTAKIGASNDAR